MILCLLGNMIFSFAQKADEDYILETKYRNPIDTTDISNCKTPCMVLFVHSTHANCYCATEKMLKALSEDSLHIRKKKNIKLYVIYPCYSEKDIRNFESYCPKNAIVAFDTNQEYFRNFSQRFITPYIVFYDGKGNHWTKEGGTYGDLILCVESWMSNNKLGK